MQLQSQSVRHVSFTLRIIQLRVKHDLIFKKWWNKNLVFQRKKHMKWKNKGDKGKVKNSNYNLLWES
jgi:hypothetical protein